MERRKPIPSEISQKKESKVETLGAPIISFGRPGHEREYLINAERFPPEIKLRSDQDSFDYFFHQITRKLQEELGSEWSVDNRNGTRIEIRRRIGVDDLPPIDPSLRGTARLDKIRELEEPLYRDDAKIIAAVKKVFGERYEEPVMRA